MNTTGNPEINALSFWLLEALNEERKEMWSKMFTRFELQTALEENLKQNGTENYGSEKINHHITVTTDLENIIVMIEVKLNCKLRNFLFIRFTHKILETRKVRYYDTLAKIHLQTVQKSVSSNAINLYVRYLIKQLEKQDDPQSHKLLEESSYKKNLVKREKWRHKKNEYHWQHITSILEREVHILRNKVSPDYLLMYTVKTIRTARRIQKYKMLTLVLDELINSIERQSH